jgi:hypothetical protein
MSWIMSIGVLSPSYYQYMAVVMSERLEKIVLKKRLEIDDIPKGILSDVKGFFEVLLDGIGTGVHKNPQATLNLYVIAMYVMKPSKNLREVDSKLKQYGELVNKLNISHDLSEEESGILKDLQKFFENLFKLGEDVSCMEKNEAKGWWQRNGSRYLLGRAILKGKMLSQ